MLVTSKGTYFQLAERIFQITDCSFGDTPIGIGIDNICFLTELNLQKGQPVLLKNSELYLPGAVIRIAARYPGEEIPFPNAKQDPIQKCIQLLHENTCSKGLSSLCTPLLNADAQFIHSANPLCQIAYPLLSQLICAMQSGLRDDIEDAVKALIGMGIGLTPSADDVILGMIYGLLRLAPQNESTKMLIEAVAKYAPVNTNTISTAYLQAVSSGGTFTHLDTILLGLAGEAPLDIEPILKIGSSSGSEMLLGLLIAVKLIYL